MAQACSLDGRFVALLLAGGALNGLVYRVVEAGKEQGFGASFDVLGVSPFEVLVAGIAVRLAWSDEPILDGAAASSGTALFMTAMLWPSSLVAWILTAALPCAVAIGAHGPCRSGALLFAALGAWEIWSAVLEPVTAANLLALDAGGVARVLPVFRENVIQFGNVVGAAGGHQIVVLVACSTAHFLPLALLGAVALLLVRGERIGPAAVVGLMGLAVALAALNLGRLTLMAWSADVYHFVHGSSGAMFFDAMTSLMVVLFAPAPPVGRSPGGP